MKKVAYLGPKGTFTEKAAREMLPEMELVAIKPIRRVVKAVESGEAEYGVIPAENYYNGWVNGTLDALTRAEGVKAMAERAFPIVHCFGALQGHGKIECVYSKDQAIEQCVEYLDKNYPEADLVYTGSTAEAANMIAQEKLRNAATIASKKALEQAGLELLAENLCPNNQTRFITIGRENTKSTGDDKTFIVLHPHIKDQPMILVRGLLPLGLAGINLEYINSRPDHKGGYYFYLEADGHEEDKAMKIAVRTARFALDPKGTNPDTVRVLGSYQNTHWKSTEQ